MNPLKRKIKTLYKYLSNPRSSANYINNRYFKIYIKKPKDNDFKYFRRWYYGKLPRVPLTEIFPGIDDVDYMVLKGFKRIPGLSLTLNELNNIIAIQKYIKAVNIFEVGTSDGGTTLNFAANLQEKGKIYTLDLPEDFNTFDLNINSFNNNKTKHEKTGYQFRNTSYAENIIQLLDDSSKFDYEKLGIKFDLFFIDGCHDYNYVKHDTEMALKYTKENGVIIWHDYGMLRDISKYIDKLSEKHKIYVIQGTRLALSIVQ